MAKHLSISRLRPRDQTSLVVRVPECGRGMFWIFFGKTWKTIWKPDFLRGFHIFEACRVQRFDSLWKSMGDISSAQKKLGIGNFSRSVDSSPLETRLRSDPVEGDW